MTTTRSPQPWSEIPARKAGEVYRVMPAPDSVQDLLQGDPTPAQFLDRLRERDEHEAALTFMALALPARLGVWWGCLCLEIAWGDNLPPREAAARDAAVRWVLDPTEGTRQAANAPADAAGLATVAGLLAKAAFWSGGSMLPANQPVLPPPPILRPQAIRQALLNLVFESLQGHRDHAFRHFLALASAIAAGEHRWRVVKKLHQG